MSASQLRRYERSASLKHLRTISGREYALLTGRGAAGIWALLKAWGVRDQLVALPANTCYIVLWAVLKSGNRPLLLDVEAGQPSMLQFPASFHEKPAVIIPCHMYGLSAPMQSLCKWAQEQGVHVIEDAALALGAQAEGQPAGSWGDASVFSFGQGKIADHQLGGALVTDDAALAKEIERLLQNAPEWDDRLLELTNQWHGLYWPLHQYESLNPALLALYPQLFSIYGDITVYRLSDGDWQGLSHKLATLPDNLQNRARLAALYDAAFYPQLTFERPAGSILWRYPLLVEAGVRNDLLAHLWENDLHDVTRWYPSLRFMTSALAPQVAQPVTPNADHLAAKIINLRLDEGVDEVYVRRAIELVRRFL